MQTTTDPNFSSDVIAFFNRAGIHRDDDDVILDWIGSVVDVDSNGEGHIIQPRIPKLKQFMELVNTFLSLQAIDIVLEMVDSRRSAHTPASRWSMSIRDLLQRTVNSVAYEVGVYSKTTSAGQVGKTIASRNYYRLRVDKYVDLWRKLVPTLGSDFVTSIAEGITAEINRTDVSTELDKRRYKRLSEAARQAVEESPHTEFTRWPTLRAF